MHPLLLILRHFRIALGNAQPFLLALGVELVPLRSKRRQRRLVGRGEFSPGRGMKDDRAARRGRRHGETGRSKQYAEEKNPPRRQLSALYFSQAGNPRSRYASIGKSEVRIAASVSSISRTCCIDCQYWK